MTLPLSAHELHGPDIGPAPARTSVLFVSLCAGVVGLFIGLNSAGQRRNTRSQLSWLGFFLNAGIIALAVCAVVFFYFARNPQAK